MKITSILHLFLASLLIIIGKPIKEFATTLSVKLHYPELVNKFNDLSVKAGNRISADKEIRMAFIAVLDSCANLGLDKNKYHYAQISTYEDQQEQQAEDLFTDAIIAYTKDVYQGADIQNWLSNDEISPKYNNTDNDFLLNKLATIQSAKTFSDLMNSLEPHEQEYQALKAELKKLPENSIRRKQLITTLNYYRWTHHFGFEKFIVVNIASASLRYYEQDNVRLSMNVIVGKPLTRTPRFSTYCTRVILYPYWNVPRSIAVKELLPKFRRSPAAIDALNIQVLNRQGKVIDPATIRWSAYNSRNFPYTFRQTTGCDNSLGVIKFDLSDPFSVYLHDTNFRRAFKSGSRYLSHGCIRVEKPLELGNLLLENKLDTNYLNACVDKANPTIIQLKQPIPVFVVYMIAETDTPGAVHFNKDVYHLYQN